MSNKDVNSQKQTRKTLRFRELETLYNISNIIATGARQRQALAEVLDTLDSELGMSRAAITLLIPDGDNIMTEISHGFSKQQSRNVRYKIGEGITGQVMQTGKPMVVPKISEEPLFLNRFKREGIMDEEITICHLMNLRIYISHCI